MKKLLILSILLLNTNAIAFDENPRTLMAFEQITTLCKLPPSKEVVKLSFDKVIAIEKMCRDQTKMCLVEVIPAQKYQKNPSGLNRLVESCYMGVMNGLTKAFEETGASQ